MPAYQNLFLIMSGFDFMYSYKLIIHLAPRGLTILIHRSTGCGALSFPSCSWWQIYSEYHSWFWPQRNSLAALSTLTSNGWSWSVQLAGRNNSNKHMVVFKQGKNVVDTLSPKSVKKDWSWVVWVKLELLCFLLYVGEKNLLQVVNHCFFIRQMMFCEGNVPIRREFDGRKAFVGFALDKLIEEVESLQTWCRQIQ